MSTLNETCFNCRAPLVMANVKSRNVRCEYCGMETMLSDQTWRQIQAANAPPPVSPVHMSFQMQENAFKGARKMARGISLMVFLIILASFGFAIYMQRRIQNQVSSAFHPSTPGRRTPAPSGVAPAPRPPTDPDKMVTITLDSSPAGAKIYLNARLQEGKVTPAKVETRQSSDILIVKLTLDGYNPYIKKLTPTTDLADNAMLVKEGSDEPAAPTPGKTHRSHH